MNILLLEDDKHRITFFKNGLKQHKLTICSHIEHEITSPCIILHTENTVGREAMETLLEQSHSIPYGKLKKMGLSAVLKLVRETE